MLIRTCYHYYQRSPGLQGGVAPEVGVKLWNDEGGDLQLWAEDEDPSTHVRLGLMRATSQRIEPATPGRLRLILPDSTAIGVRLSHASRRPRATSGPGARLSNAWSTYPMEADNPGKLGLNRHSRSVLEWPVDESPRDRCCLWEP